MSTSDADYIRLPTPEFVVKETPDPWLTLDDLAISNPGELIGAVADQNSFDASLGLAPDAPKDELYIKAPGTDIFFPEKYRQFVPALQDIMKDYQKIGGVDGYCSIGVLQRIEKPVPNAPRYIFPHKDFSRSDLNDTGASYNHVVYIVSNALTTGISTRAFSAQELVAIKSSSNPTEVMQEILRGPDVHYTSPKPHEIIRFDSTAAHALQNPLEDTLRTAFLVTFTPPERPAPEKLLNPILEAEVEHRRQASSLDQPYRPGPTIHQTHLRV